MSVFGSIVIATLASIGVALALLDFVKRIRAKRTEFLCICFGREFAEGELPEMMVICRTDAEQDEIIRRISELDDRKIYLKHL